MDKDMKKGKFYMKLNSLKQNPDDPSLLDALFVIHDFEKSWNGQVITEEVASENMKFLVNKPIVCKYIPKSENDGLDALTSHEEFIDTDRNTGEEFISTGTDAIGVFTEVYIDDFTDENGVTKRVLYGKAVLWFDKCRNVCLLLDEWVSNNILIPASVEYMYYNFNMVDGVEYIQSPLVYLAHALLNAEDRNDYEKVYPAYDSARLVSLNMEDEWNKAVAQISNDNNIKANGKEGNDMDVLKKVCEISKGDLKWKIYDAMAKVMVAEDYNKMWISDYDIYDTYFIYESWANDNYEYHKVEYSKNDETDEITVNFEGKSKVERTVKWEAVVNQLEEKTNELTEKVAEIETLQVSLNEKEEAIKTLVEDKENLSTKFNEATTTLTSLNERLEELKEVEEKYNAEKFEKALNERVSEFEVKFKGINAMDKFETEEVQDLIKDSINNNESLISLNSMLVELIPHKVEEKKDDKSSIKDFNSKEVKNLIPKDNSFESRYLV